MRSRVSSSVSCASHWKGVCALGTKGETAAVTWRRGPPCPAASRVLRLRSKMASRSSRVSPGRPIMKYSLTCRQPCCTSFCACRSSSSSVTPLLMASRRRWLPASGARVAPVRRMPAIRAMMESSTEPTRSEGSASATCCAAQLSAALANSVLSAEKSPALSARKESSSKPVSARHASTSFSSTGKERSRTGRQVMPAWQKRQPRVQPRAISRARRLCTAPMGATWVEGYKASSRSGTIRRTALG